MTISLLSYGLGNLGSVINMLKRVGVQPRIISSPDEILNSDRVLLPGIGAFDAGMRRLDEQGLTPALQEFAASGRPIFGICLGMQLLLNGSEEGSRPGLGLIQGSSFRFQPDTGLRVPHMGWNLVAPTRTDPLVADLPDESRFYFVHSYWVRPTDEDHVLGVTSYGVEFASVIRRGNVMGAQFHPEKSHAFGQQILRNFSAI